MVFFCEEQTGFLKSVAVEIVGVLEDLAHRIHRDVLSKDVLALSLHRLDVVSVSQLHRNKV